MAAISRLLGKDNQIRLTQGGVPQASLTAIKSVAINFNVRALTEMYQGETQNRKDTIFDDVTGTIVIHPEAKEVFTMIKKIVDRAISRDPNADQITLVTTVRFPNGETARLVFPELEFDPIPYNSSNRDAYVDITLSFHAEKFSLL